ncbi:MAG: alpha/beta hydrolase-fold protein [Bacteroidota bacterium]
MKHFFLILTALATFSGFSQKVKDTILSKKMDMKREITISVPASYDSQSKKTYPLLILLDGDYLFDAFHGALAYGNYWDDLPEMIVVGVSQNKNDERFDDCNLNEEGLPEGKAARFFEFVGGELLPYIESKYRIAPFKIIAGHDITAGFMNLYLFKEQPLFNAYISLSPELGANMEANIPARLSTFDRPVFYYMSSADGDIKKMKEDIKLLDDNIKTVKNEKLNYKFDDFKGATHYSLVLYSIPNALYQFFATYSPISTNEFQEKIVKLPSGYVDYLRTKYESLEKTLGFKTTIRINDFRAIESAIVKNKAYGEFEQLAQLANKAYPRAMLGEYFMARFYENTGDIKRAVKSYQNAFTLEPIGYLNKDMMLNKADELRTQIKK